jgi:uncharacterized repeat protein (TIGR01451 family)
VTLPLNGTATFVLTGTVASNAAAGFMSNTAGVAPMAGSGVTDTNSSNNSSTATVTVQVSGNLKVVVTPALLSTVTRGQVLPYVITVTNPGSTPMSGQLTTTNTGSVNGLQIWTCAATAGSSCVGGAGTGDINQTVTVVPGGNVTFTYSTVIIFVPFGKAVATSAPFGSNIVETATLGPVTGYVDTNPADNSSSVTSTVRARLNLALTKSSTAANPQGSGTYTYTVRVSNTGQDQAVGVAVSDSVPAGVVFVSWSCATTGGANSSCGGSTNNPAGGAVSRSINVAAGGSVTFTITARRVTTPTTTHGLVNNIATVTEPPSSTQLSVTGSPATAAVTFS